MVDPHYTKVRKEFQKYIHEMQSRIAKGEHTMEVVNDPKYSDFVAAAQGPVGAVYHLLNDPQETSVEERKKKFQEVHVNRKKRMNDTLDRILSARDKGLIEDTL